MTDAKKDVMEVSKHPLRTYIVEAVQSGHLSATIGDAFTMDALQRQLHADGYGQHAKNMRELGEALELAGVEQGRKTENGTRRRFYRLPDKVAVLDCEPDFC